MSLVHQAYLALLVVAVFAAGASGLVMIETVHEGDGLGAWVWAALFFASCTVAAWCFWGLV